MNISIQKIILAIFAAIGSVFMMVSAIGTLWAWTTPDVSLGFRFMFPLLAASLFALVFMLSMALLPEPSRESDSSNPTPVSVSTAGKKLFRH
jgi:hypothetical protein